MGGKEIIMREMYDYSRSRGWEKRTSKPAFLYVAYIIFMLVLMYLCKATIYDDPGKTAVGCVFLVVFAELERDLEKYYNGISGFKRVPLISIMWAGRILGLGLFFSSAIMIMVR